jgi:hypothetical protein
MPREAAVRASRGRSSTLAARRRQRHWFEPSIAHLAPRSRAKSGRGVLDQSVHAAQRGVPRDGRRSRIRSCGQTLPDGGPPVRARAGSRRFGAIALVQPVPGRGVREPHAAGCGCRGRGSRPPRAVVTPRTSRPARTPHRSTSAARCRYRLQRQRRRRLRLSTPAVRTRGCPMVAASPAPAGNHTPERKLAPCSPRSPAD